MYLQTFRLGTNETNLITKPRLVAQVYPTPRLYKNQSISALDESRVYQSPQPYISLADNDQNRIIPTIFSNQSVINISFYGIIGTKTRIYMCIPSVSTTSSECTIRNYNIHRSGDHIPTVTNDLSKYPLVSNVITLQLPCGERWGTPNTPFLQLTMMVVNENPISFTRRIYYEGSTSEFQTEPGIIIANIVGDKFSTTPTVEKGLLSHINNAFESPEPFGKTNQFWIKGSGFTADTKLKFAGDVNNHLTYTVEVHDHGDYYLFYREMRTNGYLLVKCTTPTWLPNDSLFPATLTLLAIDTGTGWIATNATNPASGVYITRIVKQPVMYASNQIIQRTYTKSFIIRGENFLPGENPNLEIRDILCRYSAVVVSTTEILVTFCNITKLDKHNQHTRRSHLFCYPSDSVDYFSNEIFAWKSRIGPLRIKRIYDIVYSPTHPPVALVIPDIVTYNATSKALVINTELMKSIGTFVWLMLSFILFAGLLVVVGRRLFTRKSWKYDQ